MKLVVKPYLAMGADGFHVILMDGDREVEKTDYRFHHSVSYTAKEAEYTHKLRTFALEQGRDRTLVDDVYPEKPYVPEVLSAELGKHHLTLADLEVQPGWDEWDNEPISDELVEAFKDYLKEVTV